MQHLKSTTLVLILHWTKGELIRLFPDGHEEESALILGVWTCNIVFHGSIDSFITNIMSLHMEVVNIEPNLC